VSRRTGTHGTCITAKYTTPVMDSRHNNKDVMLQHTVQPESLFRASVTTASGTNVISTHTVSLPPRALTASDKECILTLTEWRHLCSCGRPFVFRTPCHHVRAVVRFMSVKYPGYPVAEDALYDFRWLATSLQDMYVQMHKCAVGALHASTYIRPSRDSGPQLQPPRFVRAHDTHVSMQHAVGTNTSEAYLHSVADDFQAEFPLSIMTHRRHFTPTRRIPSTGEAELKKLKKLERQNASLSLLGDNPVPPAEGDSGGASVRHCGRCGGVGHNKASCAVVVGPSAGTPREAVATDSDAVAADSEAVAADSEVVAADSEAVAADSEVVAADSEAVSAGEARAGTQKKSRSCKKCRRSGHNSRSCPNVSGQDDSYQLPRSSSPADGTARVPSSGPVSAPAIASSSASTVLMPSTTTATVTTAVESTAELPSPKPPSAQATAATSAGGGRVPSSTAVAVNTSRDVRVGNNNKKSRRCTKCRGSGHNSLTCRTSVAAASGPHLVPSATAAPTSATTTAAAVVPAAVVPAAVVPAAVVPPAVVPVTATLRLPRGVDRDLCDSDSDNGSIARTTGPKRLLLQNICVLDVDSMERLLTNPFDEVAVSAYQPKSVRQQYDAAWIDDEVRPLSLPFF
jgi:hypothetical protein